MRREEHLAIDKKIFGKEFPDVHGWIDSEYPKYFRTNPFRHWLAYHHEEAIREKYGAYTENYNVACMHVICDFLSHFNKCCLPRDKYELMSILGACGELYDEET